MSPEARRAIDVPERIETARLILRCARGAEDAAALNAAVRESLPELAPWMPWAQSAPSLAETEAVCRRMRVDFLLRNDLVVLVFERRADGSEGELVGGSGLHRIDWTVRRFEIGYWCRTSWCGRGLVTEAARGLAAWAFTQLHARRVEIRTDAANQRSRRVAERAGFDLEGVLRQDSLSPQGTPRDTCVYARIGLADAPA